LTAAIAELLPDEDRRRSLGEKARRRAERLYSVPVACVQLIDAWRSAARSGKPDADKRNDA
jgi:glycosyltransferase involved in cell wall biosynthesis